MPTELLVALIVVIIVLASGASWLGVRKLAQKHTRSAVADSPHKINLAKQQVVFIYNPTKNGSDAAKTLISRSVSMAGWPEPLLMETTAEDPGFSMAAAALEAKADVVIVGGGDGTVRAVGQTLRHTEIPLGIIPLGTGNLLARNLSLDVTDIAGCVQIALFGHQRHIDAGLMELEDGITGAISKHSFMVIAGLGMDADVMNDTNSKLKEHVGWLAYSEAGLRHLAGRRKKISITLDDEPAQQRKVRSVLFANCGLLPGGIDFVPGALIDDGVLDVVVISPRSAFGWLAMAGKVVFQHKNHLPVINFYRSRNLTIRTVLPVETQIDGDPSGPATAVKVSVEPKAVLVRVAAPNGPA
ncbi:MULTISPECIES: diacylglycerol/lipid kinase family protein [Arthrobacter]|uniref:Diacylglycerol kinase n=1 Tax=Arthrobacter psychrochitiniphilus TaxID=291045 RepID=A0A2V3DRX8_9MICC|nr:MULTISPECIES: diacylglycerol kinase family protein [Arthrobacter]NYG19103.1 diacylglycerol kinase family enzyme [Arthrobacter psychrochitiniphilus]PXA65935.1 diacylglycerol kinase [Arthrobacter psychrochitiniphilus]